MSRYVDMLGKVYGKLTVISRSNNSSDSHVKWKCECSCGNSIDVVGRNLRRGSTLSCGCFQKERTIQTKRINLVGKKFGDLTVISVGEKNRDGKLFWVCLCRCGNTVSVRSNYLRKGNTKSCGCYNKERFRTHGKSRTRIHNIWKAMIKRCKDTESYVGKRNIKVCDRWLSSFEAFYADMGDPPTDKHSIDRIDNDGDYTPSNCRWANAIEQSNNKSNNRIITFNGITKSMKEWSNQTGINYFTLRYRLSKGMTIADALTCPVKPRIKC